MSKAKPAPTQRNGRPACVITAAALRLVVERGHLGITNELVQSASGRTSTRVGTALAKLAHGGRLVAAKVPGHLTHWFANDELAQRWMATTPPAANRSPTERQRPPVWRTEPAPVELAPAADTRDTPPVVPAHVAVDRRPTVTHDPRYQCAPGERPYGAGFAAAGIGRDVTTGQPWGRRA